MTNKAVGRFVEDQVWDAHVSKANSSDEMKLEYKKSGWYLDPYEINAKRIQEGKEVGEHWLWGRQAAKLVLNGLVTESQLQAYREMHLQKIHQHFSRTVYTNKEQTESFDPADRIKQELADKHEVFMKQERKKKA